ncbi:GntR family transcriptional regulator [Thermoflavimicrobium daqui]|uniref:GntR family transcriptional regulator n=1 Tax=Thermoflavimicrobium daqui TaxID=2137476 RepID=A0A364K3G8_9BACL|nr:GntR family transcriptional regulator [Thermoflavimicrobium daqui]RAL23308.1 GntR family transcriptional regulator [Thermoflavimicrobium daqui]
MILPIEVNLNSSEPIYHQIKHQLRDLIVSGQLPAGTSLPSIRALAQSLSCSVITTRRAYQDLEYEGLIYTRQGRGTFVAEVKTDQSKKYKQEVIEQALNEAIQTAIRLHYPKEELQALFQKLCTEIFPSE